MFQPEIIDFKWFSCKIWVGNSYNSRTLIRDHHSSIGRGYCVVIIVFLIEVIPTLVIQLRARRTCLLLSFRMLEYFYNIMLYSYIRPPGTRAYNIRVYMTTCPSRPFYQSIILREFSQFYFLFVILFKTLKNRNTIHSTLTSIILFAVIISYPILNYCLTDRAFPVFHNLRILYLSTSFVICDGIKHFNIKIERLYMSFK